MSSTSAVSVLPLMVELLRSKQTNLIKDSVKDQAVWLSRGVERDSLVLNILLTSGLFHFTILIIYTYSATCKTGIFIQRVMFLHLHACMYTIIPICGSSPNCFHIIGSTQLSRTSLYDVALHVSFTNSTPASDVEKPEWPAKLPWPQAHWTPFGWAGMWNIHQVYWYDMRAWPH